MKARKSCRDLGLIIHWKKVCDKYRRSNKILSSKEIEQWKYAEGMLKKYEKTPIKSI